MNEMLDPRKTFGEAVIEAAKKNPDIVVLSADSGSGSGLKDFPSLFPGRHFEFGIMEQGIMGYASGLATTGKIPVFAAIAPFVTARPFEMFRNDLGYMNQNVKVVGRCASLTYNQLGATHHSIDDVAIIRTIPGVTIINPGDPVTIKKGVNAMIEHTGPCYMKIGSPKMPVLYPEDIDFRLGKGIIVKDGRDVALIGTGTVLSKAFIAARLLEEAGISVRLIDIHTVKPLDRELILSTARDIGRIVTVEEHFITGGLGSAIAELCSQEYPVKMKMIG
ncbi:MAG TPA: transketolase C-terminal domain-containing protein, partial [Bacteroidales bacterium]|nr:transketolase C-terminal domain-containing protein [Bacteroidales bacterium]